jgi:hypothetical protein
MTSKMYVIYNRWNLEIIPDQLLINEIPAMTDIGHVVTSEDDADEIREEVLPF